MSKKHSHTDDTSQMPKLMRDLRALFGDPFCDWLFSTRAWFDWITDHPEAEVDDWEAWLRANAPADILAKRDAHMIAKAQEARR
jgi:hypothetical protein